MGSPSAVYGVDFSGAKDAGKKIWIAEIECDDEPVLIDCSPAAERFGVSTDRAVIHRALAGQLATLFDDAVVGLDFPFSIPQSLVHADDWETFLLEFPGTFVGPEDFRRRCKSRAARLEGDTDEYKRACEKDHEGLPAYHYYLFKQTFYGIRDVLRPLVLSGAVRVPPMQSTDESRTTVIETYPAGVLDELDAEKTHRDKYKQSNEDSREKRQKNLEVLEAQTQLVIDDSDHEKLRRRILDDSEGDGLDAALAAYAAWTYADSGDSFDHQYDPQEGWIYV